MANDNSSVTPAQIAAWHLIALAIAAAASPYVYYGVDAGKNWGSTFVISLVFGAIIWVIWLLFRWSAPSSTKARVFFTSSWCALALSLIGQWSDATKNSLVYLVIIAAVIVAEKVLNIIIENVHGAQGQNAPAPLPAAPGSMAQQHLAAAAAAPRQQPVAAPPVVPLAPEPPLRPAAKEPDTIQARQMEEAFYEQVATEMAARQVKKGLWAKALAQCDGSPERTKALYIKLRVQSLKDEAVIKAEEERRLAAEQERQRIEREKAIAEQKAEAAWQRLAEVGRKKLEERKKIETEQGRCPR